MRRPNPNAGSRGYFEHGRLQVAGFHLMVMKSAHDQGHPRAIVWRNEGDDNFSARWVEVPLGDDEREFAREYRGESVAPRFVELAMITGEAAPLGSYLDKFSFLTFPKENLVRSTVSAFPGVPKSYLYKPQPPSSSGAGVYIYRSFTNPGGASTAISWHGLPVRIEAYAPALINIRLGEHAPRTECRERPGILTINTLLDHPIEQTPERPTDTVEQRIALALEDKGYDSQWLRLAANPGFVFPIKIALIGRGPLAILADLNYVKSALEFWI